MTFTAEDADKAAVLAGIAKSPRDYAPSAKDTGRVVRRRNQTLTLMLVNGFISLEAAAHAKGRTLQIVRHDERQALQAPAVVEQVLEEFELRHLDLTLEDQHRPAKVRLGLNDRN
jgi:membrane peptidoglycan carboxypeptidase